MRAARLVLPSILPRFFAAYPEIRVEVIAEESFVDMLAAGCDAGIRYEERLEQDMLAVPIEPRSQRMAAAASLTYLARRGYPAQPHELLNHTCMRARFASAALVRWQFTKEGEPITIDPSDPLLVQVGGAIDLAVEIALAGTGIIYLFEGWLRPYIDHGLLDPVLGPWWPRFSGPFLYYSGRKLLPAPLRAFIDFIRQDAAQRS